MRATRWHSTSWVHDRSTCSIHALVHVLQPRANYKCSHSVTYSKRLNETTMRYRNRVSSYSLVKPLAKDNLSFQCQVDSVQSDVSAGKDTLSAGDKEKWEECSRCLSELDLSVEEVDKILSKAFGWVHSPYWGEEKKQSLPDYDVVSTCLTYLRSIGLSNDDLQKLLKKFPELLGCNMETEIRNNVAILEREWGIKGNSLRNVLLRNPRVLGYNVDCKGDCMAQCTRCWARF